MRTAFVGALAWGLMAAGAAAQAGPQTYPADDGAPWRWTATPSHADVWSALDDAGLGRRNEGEWVVVECVVGRSRRLEDCEVTEESVPSSKVGEAALRLARRYRAASVDADGRPTEGRRAALAIGYGGSFVI